MILEPVELREDLVAHLAGELTRQQVGHEQPLLLLLRAGRGFGLALLLAFEVVVNLMLHHQNFPRFLLARRPGLRGLRQPPEVVLMLHHQEFRGSFAPACWRPGMRGVLFDEAAVPADAQIGEDLLYGLCVTATASHVQPAAVQQLQRQEDL